MHSQDLDKTAEQKLPSHMLHNYYIVVCWAFLELCKTFDCVDQGLFF